MSLTQEQVGTVTETLQIGRNISPSCEVWIDDIRIPDTREDYLEGDTVALTGLTVTWGRDATVDQPDPGVCAFTIHDPDPAAQLGYIHVGQRVEVYAATGESIDPDTEFITNGTFDETPTGDPYPWAGELTPTGDVDRSTWRLVAIDTSGDTHLAYAPDTVEYAAVVPTDRFSTPGQDLDAWDDLAPITGGPDTTVRIALTFDAYPGVVLQAALYLSISPWPDPDDWTLALPLTDLGNGTDAPAELVLEAPLNTDSQGLVGWPILVFTSPALPTWEDLDPALIWADTVDSTRPSWIEYGGIVLDDISLTVTAAAIPDRRKVFAGTITDATATINGDAIETTINAADFSTDLANVTIGDEPWPAETLQARANRIIDLADNPAAITVDPAIAEYEVSWRDVDAQPVTELLEDLAQSAGGVLWAAGHRATGPLLWIEDQLGSRESARQWELVDGTATIVDDEDAAGFEIISSCDILEDDVQWVQAVADVITSVDVTWREQTLDDEGNIEPTDQTVTVTDSEALARFGLNNLSVSTELTSATDATAIANRYLAISSNTAWRMSGIAINTGMATSGLGSDSYLATVMALLDQHARLGMGLRITDLPPFSPTGSSATMFVDGGSYVYENGSWQLNLNLTPAIQLGTSATWAEFTTVPWTWAQVDPTLAWSDAYGAGGPNANLLPMSSDWRPADA